MHQKAAKMERWCWLVALSVGLPSLQGGAERNLKRCPRQVQLKLREEDHYVLLCFVGVSSLLRNQL